MKHYNHILVAIAATVGIASTVSEYGFANSKIANDTIYGYSSSTGQCIVAEDGTLAVGCHVSSVGNTCIVFITESGWEHEAQAFKSPVSSPFCLLTLRRSQ